MTRLEHSVLIHAPLEAVYDVARRVDRYPEFLPGYLESRILKRTPAGVLLQRAALVRNRRVRWQSWVTFEINRGIHFEQIHGPLAGMRVDWQFKSLGKSLTTVAITHTFHLRKLWPLGLLLERWVFKPRLDHMASGVVAALKQACERPDRVYA